jgi:hypothetical protein
MIQPGQGERFLTKPFAGSFVPQGVGRENFDGDIAAQMLVVAAVHCPHAAFADFLDNSIMAEPSADHGERALQPDIVISVI